MKETIFVGNLPFSASEEEIKEIFLQHGTVYSIKMIRDRETGRPRGYGFVTMEKSAATVAMEALDGHIFGGRIIRVSNARRQNNDSKAKKYVDSKPKKINRRPHRAQR